MDKENLQIIKEGKTGHGLLIENDGYLISNKDNLIKENLDENGQWHCPNPFIVDAVFQKADKKNANGRIYPRAILEREVEKYQERIREHRALGECYTPDVEVLCEDGWKELEHVTESDYVYTLNTETNRIEIQKVERKIEKEHNGKLLHLHGEDIDEKVTPNHGYPIYDSSNKFVEFKTAEELKNKEYGENLFIPTKGEYSKQNNKFVRFIDGTEVKLLPFMRFCGLFLMDGIILNACELDKPHIAQISEDDVDMIAFTRQVIEDLDIPYEETTDSLGQAVFHIDNEGIVAYLGFYALREHRFLGKDLLNEGKESLEELFNSYVMACNKWNKGFIFTFSEILADDFLALLLKIGKHGTVIKHPYGLFEEIYEIKIDENNIALDSITIYEEDYNGTVMCIEVPNHTFFVKSNGHVHWSKNCNHPSETTIDLGRISHNIIELHWEGSTLVGKMELNITEGYRRSGICSSLGDTVANLLLNGYKIGVSSRAIGSVENKFGALIVGDDLELICWDVVSDPSTPGAWIGNEEELKVYVEQDETKPTDSIITEKINKLNEILK